MPERLPNAPIVEAVIDIQHRLVENVPADQLLFELDGYDKSTPMNRIEIGIHFQDGEMTNQTDRHGSHGYKYTNTRERFAVHFRNNGVTTSKLKPYDTWESFQPIAQKHWNTYCSKFNLGPDAVTRVAVRYVNRIMVPADSEGIRIQDYLSNAPEIPDETDRGTIHEFLCRMVLPIPEFEGEVIIISTMEEYVDEGQIAYLPLVLDIDVFKTFDGGRLDSLEQMWSIIGQMRDIKNEMFDKIVTPKALELFK